MAGKLYSYTQRRPLKTPIAIDKIMRLVIERWGKRGEPSNEGLEVVDFKVRRVRDQGQTLFELDVTLRGPCGDVTWTPAITYNYCPHPGRRQQADEALVTAWVLWQRYVMWARLKFGRRDYDD